MKSNMLNYEKAQCVVQKTFFHDLKLLMKSYLSCLNICRIFRHCVGEEGKEFMDPSDVSKASPCHTLSELLFASAFKLDLK